VASSRKRREARTEDSVKAKTRLRAGMDIINDTNQEAKVRVSGGGQG
jgi:hypothetical protein